MKKTSPCAVAKCLNPAKLCYLHAPDACSRVHDWEPGAADHRSRGKSAKKTPCAPPNRFPFRWALEIRRATDEDAARFPVSVYSRSFYKAGVATHFAEEVLVDDPVSLSALPARLRALADHYERIEEVRGDDAVVIIGRRRSSPEEEADLCRRRGEPEGEGDL